jgi:hypothetical protein
MTKGDGVCQSVNLLDYELDDRGSVSSSSMNSLLFFIASKPTLGPNKPPLQWVPLPNIYSRRRA